MVFTMVFDGEHGGEIPHVQQIEQPKTHPKPIQKNRIPWISWISGCVDFGENTKIFSRSGPGSESSSRDLVRPMAKPGLPGATRKMGDFHGIWTPKMMRQMEFNHQKQWIIQTEVSSDLLSKRILFWAFHHIYIYTIYIYIIHVCIYRGFLWIYINVSYCFAQISISVWWNNILLNLSLNMPLLSFPIANTLHSWLSSMHTRQNHTRISCTKRPNLTVAFPHSWCWIFYTLLG